MDIYGAWEQLYNPHFKLVEFDQFKSEAGTNAFVLSPQKWIESTNAIGLISKSGRGGGTYAHKDIALVLCYMDNHKQELSSYRLDEAERCLRSAKLLFEAEDNKSAANRSYYCVFNTIKSIFALRGKDYKTHQGVLTNFRSEYIKNAKNRVR